MSPGRAPPLLPVSLSLVSTFWAAHVQGEMSVETANHGGGGGRAVGWRDGGSSRRQHRHPFRGLRGLLTRIDSGTTQRWWACLGGPEPAWASDQPGDRPGDRAQLIWIFV